VCNFKTSKKSLSTMETYISYGLETKLSATATEVYSKHKHLDTVVCYQLSRYFRKV